MFQHQSKTLKGYGSALIRQALQPYDFLWDCPEDDDGNAASRRQPDVVMILKGIATSSTMKILTANFNNAMQML